MNNKLVFLFPGIKYTCDMPLLYYPRLYFKSLGYTVIDVSYGSAFDTVEFHNQDITEEIYTAQASCIDQIRSCHPEEADQVFFISKSLGTAVAGWVEKELGLSVFHYYLTPIVQTFPYMTRTQRIALVVSGTKDPVIDFRLVRNQCHKENLPYLQIDDVGHRLEGPDVQKNLDIVKTVVQRMAQGTKQR
jgi:hypothetical protein